jgi:AcrR family transcriptional regulator
MAKALKRKPRVEASASVSSNGRRAGPVEAPKPSGESYTRDEWVAMARKMLIRDGIAGVKIDRLAKRLGVTRGGFYWRFAGQQDLLDALLDAWRETNTQSALQAVRGPGTPLERFTRLMHVWIEEIDFNPAFDLAVRDWARISPKVDKAVRQVDGHLVEALTTLFCDAGYAPDEGLIRARIVHYHQVGYYALRVKQTRDGRYAVADLYLRILTGLEGSFFDGVRPR